MTRRKTNRKSAEPFTGWTLKALKDMAPNITFERGLEYHKAGAVEDLRVYRNEARAEVPGNYEAYYDICLRDRGEGIDGSCTCPAYEDNGFCKHCVAACLALFELRKKQPTIGGRGQGWATLDDVEEYLKQVDRKKLEDWVMQQALESPDFHRHLAEAAEKVSRR